MGRQDQTAGVGMQKRWGGRGNRAGERICHSPYLKAWGCRGYLGWCVRGTPPPERSVRRGEDAGRSPLPPGEGGGIAARDTGASHRQQLQRRHSGAPPGMFRLGGGGDTPKRGSPTRRREHGTGRVAGGGPLAPRPRRGQREPLRVLPSPRTWGKREAGEASAELGHLPPQRGGLPGAPLPPAPLSPPA